MPEGTKVYPARAGVVVALRQDVTVVGPDPALRNEANYVILRHDDGTFAEYYHVQPGGVLVALGDTVTTSQPIALSGNTGYTSGPHLHFVVFNTLDGIKRVAHPIHFELPLGTPTIAPEGGAFGESREPASNEEPPAVEAARAPEPPSQTTQPEQAGGAAPPPGDAPAQATVPPGTPHARSGAAKAEGLPDGKRPARAPKTGHEREIEKAQQDLLDPWKKL